MLFLQNASHFIRTPTGEHFDRSRYLWQARAMPRKEMLHRSMNRAIERATPERTHIVHPLAHLHLTNIIAPSLELFAEAQMVVTMRLAGLAGLWPVGTDETHRMIAEKGPALMNAAAEAGTAALGGQRLDEILLAAITLLTGIARDNRRRLCATRA
ncbi:hypothetical protein [Roseovarius sp. MBR-6]|uniref:hypothetical protein n=1 Tax=Roseovarius sp. MBR-6 TaxID=3156459 RepID=UPI0033949188